MESSEIEQKFNQVGFMDALRVINQKIKPLKQIGLEHLCYQLNISDKGVKHFYVDYENEVIVVMENNPLFIKKGRTLKPYDIVKEILCGGSDKRTMGFMFAFFDDIDIPYIRVGTQYFKIIKKKDESGIEREILKEWNRQTLLDDYDKNILDAVKVYDDFKIEPDNLSHSRVVGGMYNLYEPFSHFPDEKFLGFESIKWTDLMMRHVFGQSDEKVELGYKYLQCLYLNPKQVLPILVLISTERQTGKSTFVNMMQILFGDNAVVINPENISSQFNSSYATKNVICIEESTFENKQATEKLKNLATQKKITVNKKHVGEYSVPFFGKLIITSNDESKFSKVDEREIRYWVRKLPTLTGKANHNILEDFRKEIPQLLAYLKSRDPIDNTKSRMVFTAEEIETNELATVKEESRPEIIKEIEVLLDDYCMNNDKVQYIKFTVGDLKDRFFANDHRWKRNYIAKSLRDYSDKIQQEDKHKVSEYVPFESNDTIDNPYKKIKKGKIFIVENPYFTTP